MPFRVAQSNPKATVSHTWRNLLVADPLNIPHKIPSCLFCTCLLSQAILTMGGPGSPPSERLSVHRNTFSLSPCQREPQPRAEFSEHSGHHREPSLGLWLYLHRSSCSLRGLFPLVLTFSLWQSLCACEEHRAALCISLVLPLLAASVRAPSPEQTKQTQLLLPSHGARRAGGSPWL